MTARNRRVRVRDVGRSHPRRSVTPTARGPGARPGRPLG